MAVAESSHSDAGEAIQGADATQPLALPTHEREEIL
jgi:hypothetical protein